MMILDCPFKEKENTDEKGVYGMSATGREKYDLPGYEKWLREQERSEVTIRKYLQSARCFLKALDSTELTKERTLAYKELLISGRYRVRSVNSMIAALNSFLRYLGREGCRLRAIRCQHEAYCDASRELSREEYLRLLEAARKKPRLYLLLQTIGGTGIRISELKYFTVETVHRGEIEVTGKGKRRKILLPSKLRKVLLQYAQKAGIVSGIIFRTKTGHPLDRSNVWSEMKALCAKAQVEPSKVYPHNLRKLFARSFYRQSKDLSKLADVLGHSNIETTRIYIITSGWEHMRELEKMKLVI